MTTVTSHSCPGAMPAHFTQPNFFTPTPVRKLCLSSKGSLLSPPLLAHSATFNWKFKYSEHAPTTAFAKYSTTTQNFLLSPPSCSRGTPCQIHNSLCNFSVLKYKLGTVGCRPVSEKSKFHQLLCLSLEPTPHQLFYNPCGSCKRKSGMAGMPKPFCRDLHLISLMSRIFKAQPGSQFLGWPSCTSSHLY